MRCLHHHGPLYENQKKIQTEYIFELILIYHSKLKFKFIVLLSFCLKTMVLAHKNENSLNCTKFPTNITLLIMKYNTLKAFSQNISEISFHVKLKNKKNFAL